MGRGDRNCAVEKADEEFKSREGHGYGRKGGVGNGGGTSPNNVATPSRGNRSKDSTAGGDRNRGPASALEDLMRRKGVDEAWSALEEMQRQGATTDKYTVSRMLMKTVGDGRTRLNPARIYRGISLVERFIEMQPKDVDEVLFNALLDTCSRLKDLSRLEATVNRMRELKVSPSPVTLGILVKTYGQAGDLQKVLQVWTEMEKQRGQANAVTYGCMIDACVKCGHLEKAVEIFQGMRQAGKHRNTILYTTLIKGYGLDKDLQSALALFREMPQEGVPYNTITYNSILDACVKSGDLATAEALLREMTTSESAVEPDLITFSTLLKGYCHIGDLDKALEVAESIKARGLRCDELVYNTLMDGCVKANDISAGVGLFEEMVQNGMRPSAITHSILARLYQRAGYEEDASEAVASLYQTHGIERPQGGDRGKGFGKRWNPRNSPNGRGGGDRNGNASPFGSPSVASTTSGMRRGSGDFGDAAWNAAFGNMPAMPGFDSEQPSACSTPVGSPLASPSNCNSAPYLPMEALRGAAPFVPPMPGSCGGQETPYSAASCTPVGSMPLGSFPGSLAGSPACSAHLAGSPHQGGAEYQHGFGLPASPAAYGPCASGAPVQGAAGQQLPPWPFNCGMGGAPGSMPSGEVMPASLSTCPPQGAGPSVLQAQAPPFPMPLSPPHDLSYSTGCPTAATGMNQAFFESWGSGPMQHQQYQQQVGGGGTPMGTMTGTAQYLS
jgi:pentatricopeptide repeat protein